MEAAEETLRKNYEKYLLDKCVDDIKKILPVNPTLSSAVLQTKTKGGRVLYRRIVHSFKSIKNAREYLGITFKRAPYTTRTKPIYECHVTFVDDPYIKVAVTPIADIQNWKTSRIAGDPVLGDKTFFYATKHSNDYKSLKSDLKKFVSCFDKSRIVREKIEMIVYDTKRKLYVS